MRKLLTAVLILAALLMAWVTLTVPMVAATAPALITIALVVATYFAWPKRNTP